MRTDDRRLESRSQELKAEIVKAYVDGASFEDLRIKYGISFYILKRALNAAGHDLRRVFKNPVNKDYFKVVDSHEKAYWVGFIMADGCLRWNRPKTQCNGLYLSLQKRDGHIVRRFAKNVRYGGKLFTVLNKGKPGRGNKQDSVVLGFRNEAFVSELEKYGLFPNKSIVHPFFREIPDQFLPSAVLGYFDGDGTVSLLNEKGHKSPRLAAGFISSHEFGTKLMEVLHAKGIKCSWRVKKTSVGIDMMEVRLKGNRSCLNLYDYMYQGGIPSLERKKAKFEWIKEQQRLGLIMDTSTDQPALTPIESETRV